MNIFGMFICKRAAHEPKPVSLNTSADKRWDRINRHRGSGRSAVIGELVSYDPETLIEGRTDGNLTLQPDKRLMGRSRARTTILPRMTRA